jgi:demethylmenaquinone methyltransferase/2-methoxy-6-polyprenyl-1,4-benzoquinol methylase
MSKFDHFDWLAPFYDRFITLDDPTPIIKYAGLPVRGKLLDAGGGTGRVSEALVTMADSIIVVDYSLGMLKQAIHKNGLSTVCTPTENLPFLSESFERVIMVDALHHVFNHQDTLQELWRVVKTGGKIVIEEPDIRHILVKVVALVEKALLMRSKFINPVRIANLLNDSDATVDIINDGYTAWVVLEKTEAANNSTNSW